MAKTMMILLMVFLVSLTMVASQPLAWKASLTHLGFRLSCDKGNLSQAARIIAVEPPWKELRLYTKDTPLAKTIKTLDQKTITRLQSVKKTSEIYLQDWSLTTTPDGWLLNVDLRQNGSAPTLVEYVAMTIPMSSLLPVGTMKWIDASYQPQFRQLGEPTLPPITFLSLELPTIFGKLTIKAERGTLTLFDRRIRPFIGKCLWIGENKAPISKDSPFRSTLKLSLKPYSVPPQNVDIVQPTKDRTPKLIKTQALNRRIPLKVHIPVPKHRQMIPQQDFVPQKSLTVSIPKPFNSNRLRRAITRILKRLDLDCSFSSQKPHVIVSCSPQLKGHDAYNLAVSAQNITIQAREEAAVFYAFQTLAMNYDGHQFAGCAIRDWADFKLRGMHLIPDNKSLLFHAPLFTYVLAPLKINHLIMESQYVQWDATSYFHHSLGMEKEDLKKLLQVAYDNYIQVTPQIQTFGHSSWMFHHGKNLDLADNPTHPVDYNVANPKTYQLIEKILDEVVETFKAKALHIGHDEITMVRNKKPWRKESQEKNIEKILEDDFLWYCRYAKKRNLKLMFWHDMLMNVSENPYFHGTGLPAVRAKIPTKNVTICYWDYSGFKDCFPGIDVFQKLGFEVYPVGWFRPNNIENLAIYAKSRNLPAMMTSTWAGYFGSSTVLKREFKQITSYVKLAAYAWNANRNINRGHHYDQAFLQLWNVQNKPSQIHSGQMLIHPNVPLIPLTRENDPFKTEHLYGLDKLLRPNSIFCGDMIFSPFKAQGEPAVLTLKSDLIPQAPEKAVLTINHQAQNLYFMQTILPEISNDTPIATYTITYADKTHLTIPIRYGREINGITTDVRLNLNYSNSTDVSWGQASGRVAYFEWHNPHPSKTITSITFSNGNEDYPFFLMGLSLR